MSSGLSSTLAVFTALTLAAPGALSAQARWSVAVEIGAERFWGGSQEVAGGRRSFRPYRPTTLGIALTRRAGGLGAGVRLQYSSAGLALEGPDALVAAKGVFTLYGVAPELLYRVSGLGSSELLAGAGPLLELWNSSGERTRTRLGAHAGLQLKVPLGRRLAGSLSAGAALVGSPFTRAQLEPDFVTRALWRRRMAGGIEYRL